MAATPLTAQQVKKMETVIGKVAGLPKTEAGRKNVTRFATKYLMWKLNDRATGPHSHGLDAKQRTALKSALNDAFGIKVAARKAAAPKQPAKKAAPKKGAARKANAKPGSGPKPVAELAAAQTERAIQS